MTESTRLARQYELALTGGAWHGPSWREVLEGVTHTDALATPIEGAHGIAAIVLHVTTWQDVVRLRLSGECPNVPPEEDWPEPILTGDAAWQAACRRSLEAGRALGTAVAAFPSERLHERRPGLTDTWFGLVAGQLQHVLYHAGQIALLKKAAR